MKIRTKFALAFLSISLLSISVITILSYFIVKETITQDVLNHLESVAAMQANRIENITNQNVEKLLLVSNKTQLLKSLNSYVIGANNEDQREMNRILLDTQSSINNFEEIYVLDPSGEVVASTKETIIGRRYSDEEFFIRGLKENSADMLFLNGKGNLKVYLSGPLYLEGKLIGVVVIKSSAHSIISLVKDYSGLGETGETLLAKRGENGNALFLTPLRFDPQAALNRVVSKDNLASPVILALLNNEKTFTHTTDYRGKPVLAATKYIQKTGWGIVAQIDKSEAFASIVELRNFLIIIISLFSILIILVSISIAQRITIPITKLAQIATEISEGDLSQQIAVTSKDEIGILEQCFNKMLERLSGDINKRKKVEHDLVNRIKELACLYDIASISERPLIGLDKQFEQLVDALPSGFQYPEITRARITLDNRKFESEDFKKTEWQLSADINVSGQKEGTVEVCYLEAKPDIEEGPFFKEERQLIDAIAERLGRMIERRQTEEELQIAEQNFRNSLDSSPLGVGIFSVEGELLYANQAALNIHGYDSVEELKATPLNKHYTPKSYAEHQEIEAKRKKGEPVQNTYEASIIRKDGEIRDIMISRKAVVWGGEVQYQVIYQDITEQKIAEKALRESESRYRELADFLPQTVFETDDKGNLTFANRHGFEAFGYTLEDFNKGLNSLQMFAPDEIDNVTKNIQRVLGGEEIGSIEYTALRKDNSTFPVLVYVAPIIHADKAVGLRGILIDISERKKMEEQLIVTDRLASVGELASGIAHEMNNPLTTVVGFSQLLLKKDLPDDVRERLELVNQEAKRCAAVAKNLLIFARKHDTEKHPTNINDIIQNVLELRAYEQRVHNIGINAKLAPNLPEIQADGFQLQQVFINIVINAEHFMYEAHGKGTLTIITERIEDTVRASFADDGPGIDREALGHIFDPFFTTKEVGKGTGLGLSISHGIIAEHGGKLYAESELGKGATFIIELPIGKKSKGKIAK